MSKENSKYQKEAEKVAGDIKVTMGIVETVLSWFKKMFGKK